MRSWTELQLEVKSPFFFFVVFTGLGCVSVVCANVCVVAAAAAGESIPIRLFLAGYETTPTMKDINKKFTVRYYLNLVLIDEEDRRYFKQQVCCFQSLCGSSRYLHYGSSNRLF